MVTMCHVVNNSERKIFHKPCYVKTHIYQTMKTTYWIVLYSAYFLLILYRNCNVKHDSFLSYFPFTRFFSLPTYCYYFLLQFYMLNVWYIFLYYRTALFPNIFFTYCLKVMTFMKDSTYHLIRYFNPLPIFFIIIITLL